jgi:hypothetical protein
MVKVGLIYRDNSVRAIGMLTKSESATSLGKPMILPVPVSYTALVTVGVVHKIAYSLDVWR